MIATVSSQVKAHSKAQVYILSLYRQLLRTAKGKDATITTAIKSEFPPFPPFISFSIA